MNLPMNEPPRRSVCFKDVEVIEFPIVAGYNHPSRSFQLPKMSRDETYDKESGDGEMLDSAAITLDWTAQTRTKINLDDFEEKQKKLRVGKKLQRMSRAVRKRILRNIGVETSDIESEDENRCTKQAKKRKSTKKRKKEQKNRKQSGRTFRMNPFGAASDSVCLPPKQPQDRFASGSQEYKMDRTDNAPKLPQRGDAGLGLPPRRSSMDYKSESDDQSGYSPTPVRQSIELDKGVRVESPGSFRARSFNFRFANTSVPKDNSSRFNADTNGLESPRLSTSQRQSRKGNLDHVTNAFGVIASQPIKLAKQPVRLAKYTTKKVRQGVDRVRKSGRDSSDDDELDLGSEYDRPSLPPGVYYSSDYTYVSGSSSKSKCDINMSPQRHDRKPTNNPDHCNSHHEYDDDDDDDAVTKTKPAAVPRSPETRDGSNSRRSSLSHVTNVIGVLAKQPVKLAKQPVRLARYTSKKVRKRVERARNQKCSDDDDEDSLDGVDLTDTSSLPSKYPLPPPPLYFDDSLSALQGSDHDCDQPSLNDSEQCSISNSISNTPTTTSIGIENGDDEIDESDRIDSTRSPQQRSRRRPSLQHVTNAIGTVAKQPYKLAKYTAKQPIKLAMYTGNTIRKRMNRRQDDDSILSSLEEPIVSDDDTILDYFESLESSQSPTKANLAASERFPKKLLSPILDGSDYNSSGEISMTCMETTIVTCNNQDKLEHGEDMIDMDDLEDSIDDDDDDEDAVLGNIVKVDSCKNLLTETMSDHENAVDDDKENSCHRRNQSLRISMTGDVHPSDEFNEAELMLDLVSDVNKEDMAFLESTVTAITQ